MTEYAAERADAFGAAGFGFVALEQVPRVGAASLAQAVVDPRRAAHPPLGPGNDGASHGPSAYCGRMGRRLRRIHVDGADYRWLIRSDGESHVEIRVWGGATGRGCRLDVRVAFNDPWLNYGLILTVPPERIAEVLVLEPVTPVVVERVVRAGLAEGWRPDAVGGSMRFALDRPREQLVPS